jgi:peptidoglycan/xylan/chitin deacetylase (PgdA/CDA1 family)
MSAPTTVLMYHAVAEGNELAGADPHYAVTPEVFLRHLDQVAEFGGSVHHVRRAEKQQSSLCVGMTFDDGHASNAAAAMRLAERGWSADFFVNPSTVGTPHYLSWAQLRDMSDAGMSIQSHGQHHVFLDDLSPADVINELRQSKLEIEDHLGTAVTVYAPAGGRQSPGLAKTAASLGYEVLCTSRVALWNAQANERWDVPRLAVLATTGSAQFKDWVAQRPLEIFKQRLRYECLATAKRLIGNQGYQRLRSSLLKAP